MNYTTKFLGLALGTSTALVGLVNSVPAQRPSRLAVSKAVETIPYTEQEKKERLAELEKQAKELFDAKEYDKSLLVLNQIAELEPESCPANTRMACWLAPLGIAPAIRQQLEEAVKKHPEDPEAYLYIAKIAVSESRLAEATLLLGRAQQLLEEFKGPKVRKDSLDALLSDTLAIYSESQQDWRGLLGVFQYQEKKDPQNARIKMQIGLVLLKMENEQEALKKLAEAADLAPEMNIPEAVVADFYLENHVWEKAAQFAEEALDKAPENLQNLLTCTEIFFRTGDTEKAQSLVEKAEKIEALDAKVLYWKGILALANNDLQTALPSFRKAKALEDENALILLGCIETMMMAEQSELHEEAFNIAKELLQSSSQNPVFLTHYAWTLLDAGEKEQAQSLLQQLLKVWKPDSNSATIMAICFIGPNNEEIVSQLLNEALTKEKNFVLRGVACDIQSGLEKHRARMKQTEEERKKAEEEEARKREEEATNPEFDLP